MASRFDAVFIQRKLFSPGFVSLLRKRVHRIFFDFDDAIFLRSSGATSTTRGKKFASIVAAADSVFAGNSYLMQAACLHADTVHLTPTCVEVERYASEFERRNNPQFESDQSGDNKRPLTLVWIGSQSTSRYLKQHLSALESIGKAYPEVRLRIVADFSLALEHLNVETIRWDASTEVAHLQSADVGIAPMSDDAWDAR